MRNKYFSISWQGGDSGKNSPMHGNESPEMRRARSAKTNVGPIVSRRSTWVHAERPLFARRLQLNRRCDSDEVETGARRSRAQLEERTVL
jgi:hypothetical protein